MKTKDVWIDGQTFMFRDYLQAWLELHPRTQLWRPEVPPKIKAEGGQLVTMSVNAWKRFCKDYGYDFNKL